MCYYKCMNKDVVYIEPEDDITDIIARIKAAKLKLVALVPPKKIGVLRSAVNTKLVAKAARQSEKVVVIVTTDPSLVKLAAAAQIPVAKNLQSRPKLPSEIKEEEKSTGEQVINEAEFDEEIAAEEAELAAGAAAGVAGAAVGAGVGSHTANAKKAHENASGAAKSAIDQDISSDDLEKADKKGEKGKKSKKGNIPTLEKYRKWIIIGAAAFVILVATLIWAFVFAPAANIAVAIRTTSNNFSENVSFVTKTGTEKPSEGVFLLESQSVDKVTSVEFSATGEKDMGEKAHGTLDLTATFSVDTINSAISVPQGAIFSRGDYQYTTDKSITFKLDNEDDCSVSELKAGKCTISTSVNVTAIEAGDKYNIGAYNSGWNSSIANVTASNSAAFTGGTSKKVTVVSQDDFNKAKEKLTDQGKEDGISELKNKFGDDMIVIESSLEVKTSEPTSTPGVDQEVGSGVTPKLSATTTFTMFAVDKNKVEEYIKQKTEEKLASDQKIYAIDTPFFENFTKTDNSYTAKLKSSTKSGPKVTEEDILEKSKGKKVGEIQSLLKSINGVSSVNVKTSFPWVRTVPDDPNKITIELKVEE